MKSHTIGVLLFGLATAASLTLLYGVDLSRSWIEVSGSVAKEYQVPIRRVQRTEKLAALTFDTCRDSENLREILDILEKRQVKTTFFVSGDWAGAHPEDVREIAEAGQELGVCGREYRDMRGLSGDEAREELAEVKEQVQELGGQPVTLFRPPGGDAGGRLVRSAEDCGLVTVSWDVDSLDWKDYGAEDIIERVAGPEGIQEGSIVLCRTESRYTAEALEGMLAAIEEQGYELVTVSSLLYQEDWYIDQDGTQIRQ